MKRIALYLASVLVTAASFVLILSKDSTSASVPHDACFTVEFHNGERQYVIDGYGTVTVSDVLARLGIESRGEISDVTFSDPSLIAVAENAGEWSLKSLAPFSTDETLNIRYADGRTEEYLVTDDNVTVHFDWTVADINTSGFYWSVQELGINYHTLTVVDEGGGTVLAHGKTETQNVITSGWLHLNSPDFWFEYKSDEHMGTMIYPLTGNAHVISIPIYNRNNAASTVTAHPSAIFTGNSFSVKIYSKFVKKDDTERRNVQTYVNGVLVDEQTGVLFPKRGETSVSSDNPQASDLIVSYDSDKYSGYSVEIETKSISVLKKEYTYKVYLNTKYKLSFNGNGNTSGSMSDQSSAYGAALTLSSNAYKKEYTVTFDANGGTCGTSSLKSAATFNGWEDRGSITYNGTSYSYSQFDAPYYSNTYPDLYAALGYDKYLLIQHYFIFGQTEGRSCTGSLPGLYPDAASVKNMSTDPGAVVPLYANWSDMPSVTLPSASKAGYTFDGWFTAATGGTLAGMAGDSYTPSSDITLYARFTKSSFDLTISETGLGTGESAVVTVTKAGDTAPMYAVSLGAGGTSVTIKDVPRGTYVIAGMGWSHAYVVKTASFEKTVDSDTAVLFEYSPRPAAPRHDEKYSISWR